MANEPYTYKPDERFDGLIQAAQILQGHLYPDSAARVVASSIFPLVIHVQYLEEVLALTEKLLKSTESISADKDALILLLQQMLEASNLMLEQSREGRSSFIGSLHAVTHG